MPNADKVNSDVVEGGTSEQQGTPASAGQVAATEQRAAAPTARAASLAISDTMHLLTVMERMARNKEVDTSKLAQIREFGQAILADQRRAAFDDALAQMQADLPTISARGTIEIRAKDTRSGERTGRLLQSTKYAKWDDINEAIKPVLKEHGFGLRFKTGLSDDGRVMVTGILSGHSHREESVFVLPHDSTGSKNAVQAIGSSTSYGKRYAAGALLNLTSRGEDDDATSTSDGFPGDSVPLVTPEQIIKLHDACEAKGCPRARFLSHIGMEKFEDIPAADFDQHLTLINSFVRKQK